jgi:hypothetical protein
MVKNSAQETNTSEHVIAGLKATSKNLSGLRLLCSIRLEPWLLMTLFRGTLKCLYSQRLPRACIQQRHARKPK